MLNENDPETLLLGSWVFWNDRRCVEPARPCDQHGHPGQPRGSDYRRLLVVRAGSDADRIIGHGRWFGRYCPGFWVQVQQTNSPYRCFLLNSDLYIRLRLIHYSIPSGWFSNFVWIQCVFDICTFLCLVLNDLEYSWAPRNLVHNKNSYIKSSCNIFSRNSFLWLS